MRTKVKNNNPAEINIGWRDNNCPINVPVTAQQVIKSEAVNKARRHIAIERGGKHARRCATILARHLARLASRCDGGTLQLHTTNQTTAPKAWDAYDGLALEARYIPSGTNQIAWDIQIFASPTYSRRQYRFAVVPTGNLYSMRERLEMVEIPKRDAAFVTQIMRAINTERK